MVVIYHLVALQHQSHMFCKDIQNLTHQCTHGGSLELIVDELGISNTSRWFISIILNLEYNFEDCKLPSWGLIYKNQKGSEEFMSHNVSSHFGLRVTI
jgi:hypothetical protein